MTQEIPRLSVLMTVAAVGGVWRYAMDQAANVPDEGIRVAFAGLGPRPSERQWREARQIGRATGTMHRC